MEKQRMVHSATASTKKSSMSKSRIKSILIGLFDENNVVYSEFVLLGQTINSSFYVESLKNIEAMDNRMRSEIGVI